MTELFYGHKKILKNVNNYKIEINKPEQITVNIKNTNNKIQHNSSKYPSKNQKHSLEI